MLRLYQKLPVSHDLLVVDPDTKLPSDDINVRGRIPVRTRARPAGPTRCRALRWRSAGESCAAPILTWTRSRAGRRGAAGSKSEGRPPTNSKERALEKKIKTE